MSDFGYYLSESMQYFKMLRKWESLPPKEYGMLIQKKRRKKKRGGKQ